MAFFCRATLFSGAALMCKASVTADLYDAGFEGKDQEKRSEQSKQSLFQAQAEAMALTSKDMACNFTGA